MASAWGTSWGASWGSSWGSATATTTQGGGGTVPRAWNPLIALEQEEKREIVAEARLVAREADTGAERKKAKELARAVIAARSAREIVALQERIEWVRRKAIELKREQDDEEIAVVLSLLH